MPLNSKTVIDILLEESKNIEERCEGYKDEIVDLVADIITEERHHRVHGTNIQQKITDKCRASGRFLAKNRKKQNDINK